MTIPRAAPSATQPTTDPRSPLRLLVIDDNPNDAHLLTLTLRAARAPFTTETATRLDEGLARAAAERFDVILLDLTLPDSEGLETVRRAVAGANGVPIVVLTGAADPALGLAAVGLGAQDYLYKGDIDGTLLVRALRYAVERGQVVQALETSEERLRLALDAARRAEAAEREQRRFSEALLDTVSALNRSLDLETVLGRVLEGVEQVVPHTGSNIMLFDEDYRSARIAGTCACYEEQRVALPPLDRPLNVSDWALMGILRTGELLMIDDVHGDERYAVEPHAAWVRSYAGAPISVDGRVIGVLNIDSDTPGALSAEQTRHLMAFAEQAALAIRNAQLYAESQQRASQLETLRQVTLDITRELELGTLLKRLLRTAVDVVGASGGALYLYDSQTDRMELGAKIEIAGAGPPAVVERGAGLGGQVWATGVPIVLSNYDNWSERLALPEANPYPVICVPVRWGGAYLGMLTAISDDDPPHEFSPEDLTVLEHLADQAAVAIHNAQLYRELESYSSYLELAVTEATVETRRAKERVEAILDHSPDVVLLLGADGRIEEANPALTALFGYEPAELRGMRPAWLAVEAHAETIRAMLGEAVTSDEPLRANITARRKDGSTFDADMALAPVYESGIASGLVCTVRDITALREIERMKDEFISTATHELRTPLTSVQGFSEILLTRKLTEERQRRYLTLINEQAAQLSRIVEDLLDISRLEAGKGLQMRAEPFRLDAIVRQEVEMFAEARAGHAFECSLPGTPPVRADAFRIGQVVRNILSNATKYSPEGGTIRVSTRTEDGRVHVAIADEGIGMTPEQTRQAFNKFYRVQSANRSLQGTGLGLTICKLIVEAHDGAIWLESAPGEGTTAHFWLPLAADGAGG